MSKPYVIDGYSFYNDKDANLAQVERKKVDYLKEHMDYNNSESILRLYEKVVADRLFKTPIGVDFLKETREYLLESSDIDDERISPIPLTANFDNELRDRTGSVKTRIAPAAQKEKKSRALFISVFINIVLVIAVIAMFFITLNADQPNILNYERAITNRYAAWEQQLTEREKAVREKERELNISIEE